MEVRNTKILPSFPSLKFESR